MDAGYWQELIRPLFAGRRCILFGLRTGLGELQAARDVHSGS